jgi:polyisoprenoid-binding protein YceI
MKLWLAPALCATLGVVALSGKAVEAAPETFTVDPVHSAILFRTKHLNVSHVYGRFNEFSGQITVDDDNLANASVKIDVKAQSLDTGNTKRDDHLRTPDFFSVAQFPTISFVSTAVKKTGDTYEVTGNLSLHGVTKLGKGPGMEGKTVIGFEGTLDLKRSDFGMTKMVGPVSDEVRLTMAFEANR